MVKNRSGSRFMHAEPTIHVLSAYTANKGSLAPCKYTEIFSADGSEISELVMSHHCIHGCCVRQECTGARGAVKVASVGTRSGNTNSSSLLFI